MSRQIIEQYISTRYQRWHEYATYQCAVAGLSDQAGDVLNEVLLNLLKKDPNKLMKLYEKQKGKYRELDFFVLRMINLNAHSKTSPYRYRYRQPLIDANREVSLVDNDEDPRDDDIIIQSPAAIEEEDKPDFTDKNEITCRQYEVIREIVRSLRISRKESEIFAWRFFKHEPFTAWEGPESMTELYGSFNNVKGMVIRKLKKKREVTKGLVTRYRNLALRVQMEYKLSLFPWMYRYSTRWEKYRNMEEQYKQQLTQLQ